MMMYTPTAMRVSSRQTANTQASSDSSAMQKNSGTTLRMHSTMPTTRPE